MKILYHHRIASKDGQYVHIEELTNALMEQGHDIHFVCPRFMDKDDFGGEGGIASKLKARLPGWFYEILELSYSLVIIYKLVVAIIKFKPDFIYERYNLYQPVGVILAKLFRLPILLEVNAPLADERIKYSGLALPRFAKIIEHFTWRNATKILPVTQVLARIIATNSGVESNKIHVIPNGINQNKIHLLQESTKKEGDLSLTIGFIGFINPWHRLDRALEAIAAVGNKDIRFICVGEGDIRPKLEAQAKALGIEEQVLFAGLVNREQAFQYVSQFDIALQPSVTEYASPLKLFEYLAAGTLIIAPDMPNIREIVNEESALLFDPKSEDGFKNQLMRALISSDELKEVQKAAQALIFDKQLTWQYNAKRVIDIANSI
jgi:glycosyltransferase involved in cell wall biosynthesis